MPVTLRDVARTAGVSVKTVSRVVNNQGEISEETRQRIKGLILEMGYRPNLVARGLVTQRTHTIGLVVPDITNPFFSEVARGVQDAGRQHNYNIFLCNTDDNAQQEELVLNSLIGQGVDGIILWPSNRTGESLVHISQNLCPIVTINHWLEDTSIGRILTDNYHGAQLAVEHLIDRGHCKIGMIAGSERSPVRVRRLGGFCDTMQHHNLPVIVKHIQAETPNIQGGYEATLQLFAEHPDMSGIFAYNDLLAFGALQACRYLKKNIPGDCAIVGFDDIQISALVNPPLTTIHLPKHEIGQHAVKRLLVLIETPGMQNMTVKLPVKLVIREST